MALPNLSDADRRAALKKAAEARQKRAALRGEIKAGKVSFAAVMKRLTPTGSVPNGFSQKTCFLASTAASKCIGR